MSANQIGLLSNPSSGTQLCDPGQSFQSSEPWFLSSNLSELKVVEVEGTQSCPTLCDPVDYTVHGILHARILEWVACPFSRRIFPTQGSNPGLPHCRQIPYQLSHKGSPRIVEWLAYPCSSGSSQPRNQTRISDIAGGFFTS